MDALSLSWTLCLGVGALGLHLLSVTLTKALRTYSRSRLEDVCARHGHPDRAEDVTHHEERTERAAETLAVITGLMLAASLGVLSDRFSRAFAAYAVWLIALGLGGLGYVLAGVVGRVFAEPVLDALWPASSWLRWLTSPFTIVIRRVETVVESLAAPADTPPRPTSVEVEIPNDADHPEDVEPDLPESTRELLQHAVALTRRNVVELMTPRSSMVMLPSSVTPRTAALAFRDTGKSRIPLYGENRDDIVGILYAKDLFPRLTDPAGPDAVVPHKLARPAYCVPESKNAYDLLEDFRAKRTQIAVVLDEFGGVVGLITVEDLLEDLVGEIDDEHDLPTSAEPVVTLDDGRIEVDGALSIEELNEQLDLKLPTDGDFLTVGGFAFHELGRLPEPGATFRYEGIEFQILSVADHSIRRLRIDKQPAARIAG